MPFQKRKPGRSFGARDTADEDLQPTGAKEVMRTAVRLLAVRARSSADLHGLLLDQTNAAAQTIDEVISILTQRGYLSDSKYAHAYAASQLRRRPIGRARLRRELTLRKVSAETTENALAEAYDTTSEDDLLTMAIEKRLRVRGQPQTAAEMKSLCAHLLRLGFAFAAIIQRVKQLPLRIDETELFENDE